MRKNFLIVLLALIFLVIVLVFTQVYTKTLFFKTSKQSSITINNHVFNLEIAKTDKDTQIGLSKYKSLPEDKGMLFEFKKADFYPFWMKDMKFAIDIIYIKNNRIVTIYNNVKPPKSTNEIPVVLHSTEPADKVLEINAGLSNKYKFKKGDEIKYDNLSS